MAARPGGEQPEVNDQSETQVNSIRPDAVASLLAKGEARTRASGKPDTLKGNVTKRWRDTSGGWSRNGRKVWCMNRRDLRAQRAGAHALKAVSAEACGSRGVQESERA